MNWILDIIIVAIMAIIIIVYTKRGCKTLIHFATPIVSFGSAYLLGPTIGKTLLGDTMLSFSSGIVKDVINSVVGENGSLNLKEIVEKLPQWLIDGTGTDLEIIKGGLGDLTVVNEENIAKLSENIAGPLASSLASVLGCIIVFVAMLIIMAIVTKIVGVVVKLPVLKQANSLLGFVLGVVSAFAYAWILCIAFSFVVEWGLIEQHNDLLRSISEDSHIFRFFCNLSLNDFINIVK